MIAFACTTINTDASALRENLSAWTGKAYVAFDRKTQGKDELDAEVLRFTDAPRSELERLCPWDSYARKNIAFIAAARDGADFIFETDDDNALTVPADVLGEACDCFASELDSVVPNDIVNLFASFYAGEGRNIWARGFPVQRIESELTADVARRPATPGVVQFLVDGNPDVDAIFRLVCGAELNMEVQSDMLPLSLFGAYHPFNSQATLWPREMFTLMYLPSSCPFRMTDIWRGYIAQRIFYELGRSVVFEAPVVRQERNEHVIHADFFNELPGYEQSSTIIDTLRAHSLSGCISEMLASCYRRLHEVGIFDRKELVLVDAWCEAIG